MRLELHVWTEKCLESENLQETWPDSYNNQENLYWMLELSEGLSLTNFCWYDSLIYDRVSGGGIETLIAVNIYK